MILFLGSLCDRLYKSMLTFLREDIRRYQGREGEAIAVTLVKAAYSHPSSVGVVWYRISRALWLRRKNPLCLPLYVLARLLYPLVRGYSGVELGPTAQIGPGLWIGHFGPTVLHPETEAGRNLTLLQGVTIGGGTGGTPTLGDDVSVGAGATLIGGIHLGNQVTVGAGAVVTKDIPDNHLALGIPAKALPREA